MKRKVMALTLALSLVFSACGNTTAGGENTTNGAAKELRQGAAVDENGNVEAILPFRYVAKDDGEVPLMQQIIMSEGYESSYVDDHNNVHYVMTKKQREKVGRNLLKNFKEDALKRTYEEENTQIVEITYNDDFNEFTVKKDLTKEGTSSDEWLTFSLMTWSISYQSFMGLTEEDGFLFKMYVVDNATGEQIDSYDMADYEDKEE